MRPSPEESVLSARSRQSLVSQERLRRVRVAARALWGPAGRVSRARVKRVSKAAAAPLRVRAFGDVVGIRATGGAEGVIAEGSTIGLSAHGIASETGTALAGTGVRAIGHIGVDAESPTGVGVRGHGSVDDGVVGLCDGNAKSGVFGFNSKTEGAAFGVVGRCESPGGTGVGGGSGPGVGVQGDSKKNNGVIGRTEASGVSGVFGENLGKPSQIAGPGVEPPIPFGVTGKADGGVGVSGISADGTGVSGDGGTYGGVLKGRRAPLRLVPSTAEGVPTVGRHESGEFLVDRAGSLFFCITGGTPGTWRRVQLVAP